MEAAKINRRKTQVEHFSFSPWQVYYIILIEGFATIAIEILTIHQLRPFVGGSVVIASLIIGLFLLFLAYGYRQDGKYLTDYHRILCRNFSCSAFILGIGLSYIFIAWFFQSFTLLIGEHSLVLTTTYLLLITAPLVFLLGQTVPITMNLFKERATTGAIGGKVLHISTIGSFLSAVLTTLVLLNYVGVAWTVFFVYISLCSIVVIMVRDINKDIYRLLVLAGLCVFVFFANVSVEKAIFVKTNSYGNYQIKDDIALFSENPGGLLSINHSMSSFLSKDQKGFPYIEFIKKILFKDLHLHKKNILVVGAGGFTLSANSEYGNKFTYIDIDRDLPKIVKDRFIQNINGDFVAADGRYFMRISKEHYSAIVLDTFTNPKTIPTYLITKEYFESVKRLLKLGGVVIMNIIARPTLSDNYSKRVDNTIRPVFSNCMVMPLVYTHMVNKIIYVCRKSESEADHGIYTDNINAAAID